MNSPTERPFATIAGRGADDAAAAFAANCVAARYEDIAPAALAAARANILDGIAVALAATTTTPACREMADIAIEQGGKAESSLLGFGGKVPAPMAAWVNAALVHSLNFNDMFDAWWSHPGATLLPVALAAAERRGKVSGKEFLTAYVLGLDMMARLGRAVFSRTPLIAVDAQMRGLKAGRPIPGLYATGEAMGGFHGASYHSGTGIGKALVFGRIAGRSAALGPA